PTERVAALPRKFTQPPELALLRGARGSRAGVHLSELEVVDSRRRRRLALSGEPAFGARALRRRDARPALCAVAERGWRRAPDPLAREAKLSILGGEPVL